MYAVFELSINSVRGIEKTSALGKENCRQIIINAVYTANPHINLTPLLERAIAGYEADLMHLATLFYDGMQKRGQQR